MRLWPLVFILTDVISYMIDIDVREKQALLAQTSVLKRATWLVERLEQLAADRQPGRSGKIVFPPGFSAN